MKILQITLFIKILIIEYLNSFIMKYSIKFINIMDVYTSKTFGTDYEFRMADIEHVLKTITLLFYQFMFTFGCVTIVTFSSLVMTFFQIHLELLVWISLFGSIGTVIYMIYFVEHQTEEQLAVFTFFETILVCCVTIFYGRDVVTLAMLCTFGITAGWHSMHSPQKKIIQDCKVFCILVCVVCC